jgi:HSP20 family protein
MPQWHDRTFDGHALSPLLRSIAMTSLRTYDPFAAETLEPFLRGFFTPMRLEGNGEVPQMRIDVEEKDKSYLVRADIPGVKKEDINVRIDGNVVQIDAESRRESDIKEKGNIVRSERYCGVVSRTFSLAREVDESKASAKYENGVLTLNLPMNDSAGSRRLTVQ